MHLKPIVSYNIVNLAVIFMLQITNGFLITFRKALLNLLHGNEIEKSAARKC